MIASELAKRAAEFTIEKVKEVPTESTRAFYSWSWIVFLVDFIVFLPLIVLVNYTFEKILPVFAIVEDEHPPAYEPVALGDETLAGSGSMPDAPVPGAPVNKATSAAIPTRPLSLGDNIKPVTSSFMSSWRLLRSHGGFRSIFRGFACFAFQSMIQAWITGMVGIFLGPLFFVAPLVSSLLLVQYSTAWVHIVMTPPSSVHFWSRLPPFKKTLAATWRPVTLFWALSTVGSAACWLMVSALGLGAKEVKFEMPRDVDGWKLFAIYSVFLLIRIFLIIPAYVTLVRVQASLLPDEQDTVIPFDRTFQGKVEPAIVGGTGYISLRDAWSTFSKAAWQRLLILYVKTTAIGMVFGFFVAAVMIPQLFLLSYKTEDKQ